VDRVTLLVRGTELKGSQVIREKVLRHPQIDIRFHTEPVEFQGHKGKLTDVTVRDTQTGGIEKIQPAGVFVFIGQNPNSGFLRETGIRLDRWGYILTGRDLVRDDRWPTGYEKREPSFLETSISGIFAAGDARAGSTKQVAAAAGEGATAALLIREHLKTL
jgi:thioredoxin reductase (NADPH)